MKISTRTRWFVAALAVAAIGAPVAQAQPITLALLEAHQLSTGGAALHSDPVAPVFPATGQPSPSATAVSADPVAPVFPETGQPISSGTAVDPNPVTPAFPETGQPYPSSGALAPVQAIRPDGFDFRDAGIGAAIASAIALLLVGGAIATRRHRRLAHP